MGKTTDRPLLYQNETSTTCLPLQGGFVRPERKQTSPEMMRATSVCHAEMYSYLEAWIYFPGPFTSVEITVAWQPKSTSCLVYSACSLYLMGCLFLPAMLGRASAASAV